MFENIRCILNLIDNERMNQDMVVHAACTLYEAIGEHGYSVIYTGFLMVMVEARCCYINFLN